MPINTDDARILRKVRGVGVAPISPNLMRRREETLERRGLLTRRPLTTERGMIDHWILTPVGADALEEYEDLMGVDIADLLED